MSSQFWLRYPYALLRGASRQPIERQCICVQVLSLIFLCLRPGCRRRSISRTRRPTSIVLCLTIFALFASTTIFSVNYTLFNQSLLLTDYIKSSRALWTAADHDAAIEYWYSTDPLKLVKDYSGLTDCGCTAALTVNISSAPDLAVMVSVSVCFLTRAWSSSSSTDHARRRDRVLEGLHYLA